MQSEEPRWRFFDDLADEYGVHVKTIIRWARYGVRGVRLKHRRLGVRYQTNEALLREFFSAGDARLGPEQAVADGPVPAATGASPGFAEAMARRILKLA